MGTQKNRLNETVLLSTQNKCKKIFKILCQKILFICLSAMYPYTYDNLLQDIPIAVAFKAMGFECEQEFVQMIGSEEEILAAIAPCLEECHRAQVFSQLQVNGRINPLTVLLIFLRKTLQQ